MLSIMIVLEICTLNVRNLHSLMLEICTPNVRILHTIFCGLK